MFQAGSVTRTGCSAGFACKQSSNALRTRGGIAVKSSTLIIKLDKHRALCSEGV